MLESFERPDGQFLRFSETSQADDAKSETTAEVQRNVLKSSKTEGGNTTTTSIEWPAGTLGPFGVIAALRHSPMQPNEIRLANVFVPPLNKIAKVEFRAKQWEPATLPGGMVADLLLVETQFTTDQGSSSTKNWVNQNGEIIKSVSPGGFKMFQVSREEAERIDGSMRVAQMLDLKIPVNATADQLRTSRMSFLIDSTDSDPFGLLSAKVNQQVKSLSARGAELTVHRAVAKDLIPEVVIQDSPMTPTAKSSPKTLFSCVNS